MCKRIEHVISAANTGLLFLLLSCNAGFNDKQADAFRQTLKEQQIGKTNFHISLPAGYQMKERVSGQENFKVFIFETDEVSLRKKFSGVINFDDQPGQIISSTETSTCKTEKSSSFVLGAPREWQINVCPGFSTMKTSIIFKNEVDEGKRIFLFGDAYSKADIEKLKIIYASFKQK